MGSAVEEMNGFYGGRQHELNKLVNELFRKPRGSILISGYRGVGKTSLVYKALSELRKIDKNIIIVMLNAAQLEDGSRNDEVNTKKIDPKKIIENLIRRLYSTTKESELDSEIKEEIDSLYKRAVASEVNIIERYQDKEDFRQAKAREQKLVFVAKKGYPILIITSILSMALQYSNFISLDWLNKIIPILVALIGPLAIFYKIQDNVYEDKLITKSADETYMSDNCIANLEFDLEKFHKDIYYKYKRKIIYIIDELDKLETYNKSKQKPNQIDEILNYFKNFFTLSNAIFVFIGDEDLYDNYMQSGEENIQKNKSYRSANYTYFTSKYFISRPLWSDLDSYLTDIIETRDGDYEWLNILKRALCFEARNDFFDLKKFLDNRITDFDETNKPIIELNDLNQDDVLKSRFHKAITLLYDEKYMSRNPLMWRENEQLIRELYNHAHNLFRSGVGGEIEDPKEDAVDSQMIRDFNGFLEYLGAFQIRQENRQNIKGVAVNIRKYIYSGNIPTEPPMHLSEATEFERRYISFFELFLEYAKAIVCAFKIAEGDEETHVRSLIKDPSYLIDELKKLGYNIQGIYEHGIEIYQKILEKEELYSIRREDVEKRTKDIENHLNNMFNQLPTIISSMIVLLNRDLDVQRTKIEKNNNVFDIIPKEYRDSFLGFPVIATTDLSRQILLIDKRIDYLNHIEVKLREKAQTHNVLYITRIRGIHHCKSIRIIEIVSPKELKDQMIPFLIGTKEFLII